MTQGWPIAARFASENRRRKSVFNPKGIAPSSPRLACQRLPWIHVRKGNNPNGGCGRCHARRAETERPQPRCGWEFLRTINQGSSFLATLGFGTESRWDSDWPRSVCAGTLPLPGWFFLDKIFGGRKVKIGNRKNHTFAENPKGISSFSPGLRAASYPG
jgi:hypothetical protein